MRHRDTAVGFVLLTTALLTGCDSAPLPTAPTPPNLTADEREELVQSQLDSQWEVVVSLYPTAERPEVGVERFITIAETAPVYVECLNEQGFDVSETGDGGVTYDTVPDVQREQLMIARYECGARFPVDPTFTIPLTDQEIEFLYAYQAGPLTECLAGEGYSIERPDSLGKYKSDYQEGTAPWSPYEQVAAMGDAWIEIRAKCPEIPEGFRGN